MCARSIPGRAGVQTLARLLVNLRAKGITKPEDVTAALGGPLGQKTEHLSGVARPIRERYGRMALPL